MMMRLFPPRRWKHSISLLTPMGAVKRINLHATELRYELPRSATAWLAIGALALFSTVIAVTFLLVGIKHIGAAQASIISTLEPVITLGLGVTLLGESISTSQLFGGALVLTAVILLAQRPAPGLAQAALENS